MWTCWASREAKKPCECVFLALLWDLRVAFGGRNTWDGRSELAPPKVERCHQPGFASPHFSAGMRKSRSYPETWCFRFSMSGRRISRSELQCNYMFCIEICQCKKSGNGSNPSAYIVRQFSFSLNEVRLWLWVKVSKFYTAHNNFSRGSY